MTEDLIVESLVAEPLLLASFVNVAPKRRTTVVLSKLSTTNREAVVRSLHASINAGHIKIVSGSLGDTRAPHVNLIRKDTLKTDSAAERGHTAASLVQIDGAKPRENEPAPTIHSDAERARLAAEEQAKLDADKKALDEQNAKNEADAKAAAEAEAKRIADEEAKALADAEAKRIADEAAAVEAKRLADEAAASQVPPVPPQPPAPSAPAAVPEI